MSETEKCPVKNVVRGRCTLALGHDGACDYEFPSPDFVPPKAKRIPATPPTPDLAARGTP